MKEYNFHISVKYGLTPQLCDFEWKATITATEFNEDKLIESFREFIKHIKKEFSDPCCSKTTLSHISE